MEELFSQAVKNYDAVSEETKKFFMMFVDETLKYRDELVADGDEPLNISEVQSALNCLEEFLKTKSLPQEMPDRIHELLIRWLKKLKA